MKKVGFIPLRKNSKGILNKNKKKMVGRPLFTWVLGEAILSDLDEVVVYTDDEEIIAFVTREYSWTKKVKAFLRSKETASDTATTESAILEYCDKIKYDFDLFCLLQATSPFTLKKDINNCINKLSSENNDSAITVARTHRFIWNKDGTPLNYDVFNRPRRQEFEGVLIENGAVYCSTKNSLQKTKNRVGGKIALVEMTEESLYEIDSDTDWLIVEQLLINRQKRNKITNKITHLFLDVDGVFTDGSVYYSKEGELLKKFDMRDGMGLEILREQNVQVMVVTSEQSEIVAKRMNKLKIGDVYLGVKDKYSLLNHIIKEKSLSMSNIAYVGDDVNDLANICSVGWSMTPNNATSVVKQHADMILPKNSGNGAIRAACEFILNYNKRFQ
jgi:N-acylneuraminate cytidylyltransferase